jgi:HTH-type transcriptional regulator/antitoxin HigA
MARGFDPDWTVPSGATLREALAERQMTQARLAQACGWDRARPSDLCRGVAPITLDVALRLEAALGISAEFWLCAEAHYRVGLARGKKVT